MALVEMEKGGTDGSMRFHAAAVGTALLVPALAFSLFSSEAFRFPRMASGEILVFLSALAGILAWRGGGPVSREAVVASLVPLSALVSASQTSHPLTAGTDLARLGAYWVFFLLLGRATNPWRFLPMVLVGGAVNTFIAWAQAAGWRPGWWVAWEGRHAVYGTFGNPNFLAEYIAPLAVLSFAFFLGAIRPVKRWGWFLAWTAFLSILVLTISRSAWLGLACGIGVFLLANRGLGRTGKKLAIIAGITALVLVIMGWEPVSNRLISSFSPGEPGIATRLSMWKVAGRIIAEHPVLGTGPGGYGLNYLEYSARIAVDGAAVRPAYGVLATGWPERPAYAGITQDAHNDALQALADRGLLGGAVFVLLLGWMGWKAVRGLKEESGRLSRSASLGAITAILVECLFGFPMRVFPTAVLLLWLVSCAVPIRPAGSRWRGAALFLAVLSSLGGLWFTARLFMADSLMNSGMNSPSGIAIMEKGLRLAPTHGELHFRMALKLIGAGRMDEAIVHLRQAMPGFKDPDVQFNLGWIALQKKDYRGSIGWFKEGLRLYPYYRPSAWRDLGAAFRGAGMKAEAVEAEAHALLSAPGIGGEVSPRKGGPAAGSVPGR